MRDPVEITGGCQCGAVRYAARLPTDEAYWCHCRMCQRAVGNVAAALVSLPRADVTWTTRDPDRYASSAIATRGFCAACGTPLTFQYNEGSLNIDLTVGSFDGPSKVRLTSHFGAESWVPGWIHHDGLPKTRSDTYAPLMARWAAVA